MTTSRILFIVSAILFLVAAIVAQTGDKLLVGATVWLCAGLICLASAHAVT
jgi:hypothetical protein